MNRLTLLSILLLVGMICLAPCAFADSLTFTFSTYEAGTGFGNVTNLLSLANTPSEIGSVKPDAVGNKVLTVNATNTSKIYTVAQLKALGFTANNLAVVFNINEPGNAAGEAVNLLAFSMDFYSSNGTPILTPTLLSNVPQNGIVPIGGNGTGTAGYILTYQNTGILTSFFSDDTNILGGSGSVGLSASGAENFYLIKLDQPGPAVPEPASLLLLGSGLVGIGVVVRRRKKS